MLYTIYKRKILVENVVVLMHLWFILSPALQIKYNEKGLLRRPF